MTARLERAFQEASTLPDHLQDVLADQLVDDVEGEMGWDVSLASSRSQDAIDRMAESALRAHREKTTRASGFDDL